MFFGHKRRKLNQDLEKLTIGILNHKATLKSHNHTVLSVEHFGYPHHKIFSGGMDQKIVVWCDKTFKDIHNIAEHRAIIRQMIRWNDCCLLSCDDEGVVLAIDVETFSIVRRFQLKGMDRRNTPALRLCKIGSIRNIKEDRFIACSVGNIFILSFSTGKILKRLRYRNFSWLEALIHPSSLYENTFYLPVVSKEQPRNATKRGLTYQHWGGSTRENRRGDVLLVNYEHDCDEKIFVTPSEERDNTRISALSILRTHGKGSLRSDLKDTEILIACGESNSAFYICDTSQIGDEHNKVVMRRKMTLRTGWIYSSLVIRDRWLCLGEGYGGLGIYDSHRNFKRVGWLETHKSSVQYITTANIMGSIHLVSGSTDKTVNVVDTGIMGPYELSKIALEDIKDRTGYLIDFLGDQKFEESEDRDPDAVMLSFLGGSVILFRSFFVL